MVDDDIHNQYVDVPLPSHLVDLHVTLAFADILSYYLLILRIQYLYKNDLIKHCIFQKFPFLAWQKKTFLENGAKLALLSGSGSAVFGLFDNVLSAEKALNILEADAGESTWKKLIKMSSDSSSVL